MANPTAFTINHHEPKLFKGTKAAGSNLLTNPGAETGDVTGWTASSPGFSAAAAASVGPTPLSGNYAFSAGAAAGSRRRTLLSDRVAVTAGARYFLGFTYGSQFRVRPYNDLKAQIRWYDAGVGGNLLATHTVYARPVPATGQWLSVFKAKRAPVGATHAAVYFKNAFKRSTGSVDVKDTTAIDDVFFGQVVTQQRPSLIESLRHKSMGDALAFDTLMWSNNARLGYKEATFSLHGPPEELNRWTDALMHHVEIYFGSARRFRGYVSVIDGLVDGRPVRYSMDQIANHIIVDGANGLRRAAIADISIDRYGRKQWYETDDNLFTEGMVQSRANYLRKRHAWPRNLKKFDDGAVGDNTLQVAVSGYMQTLNFFELLTIWYGYGVDTSSIIATGDDPSSNESILNRVRRLGNEFLDDDYSGVETTGQTLRWGGGTTRRLEEGNAYSLVEELLNIGDDSQEFLISGVWDDEKFVLKVRPTYAGYEREKQDGRWIYHDNRGTVTSAPYATGPVIPNAMIDAGHWVRTAPFLSVWKAYDDIADDPDAGFLWEVQYNAETDELTPIAPDDDSLTRGLAKAYAFVGF